jgi:hypothetical protein
VHQFVALEACLPRLLPLAAEQFVPHSWTSYFWVQAILNTTAKFVMISWVVTQRGPTYPSMFGAVSVFFTTVLDSLLLGHDLSVGRYACQLSNYFSWI